MIDGERLKQLRNEKRLTTGSMAELCEMTQQQISSYENGANITAKGLVKICAVLDCSADYLLGLSDSRNGYRPPSTITNGAPVSLYDMLSNVPYERVFAVVRSLNTNVLPKTVYIDLYEMLDRYPPKMVACCFAEFGIEIQPRTIQIDPDKIRQGWPPDKAASFLAEIGKE